MPNLSMCLLTYMLNGSPHQCYWKLGRSFNNWVLSHDMACFKCIIIIPINHYEYLVLDVCYIS